APCDAFFDYFHGGFDELECLGEAHGAQQFARGDAEYVGGDPRGGGGVVVPLDKRGDARLGDESDGGATTRWHFAVPRQGVVESFERRGGELTRDSLQPREGLLLRGCRGHRCFVIALESGVSA